MNDRCSANQRAAPRLFLAFGSLSLACLVTSQAGAQLSGTVLHATVADATTGVLLPDAEVKVQELGFRGISDILGDVRFSAIPTGLYTVEVRLMGYGPLSTMLRIPGRDSLTIMLLLRRTSQQLPPVTVTDTAPDLLTEFEQRRRRHVGGYFITETEIRARHGSTLGDIILTKIPGVGVLRRTGSGELIYSRRGPNNFRQGVCAVAIYYDGVRSAGPVSINEIGGIEYYNPGFVPVRYRELGSGCGVMLMWSSRKY